MISERLRTLRTQKKLTQSQVAEALDIQPKTYSTYECGTREPSAVLICKIALFYGVSADYVLGRTDDIAIKSVELEKSTLFYNLSKDKQDLLRMYDMLTEREKGEIIGEMKCLIKAHNAEVGDAQAKKIG